MLFVLFINLGNPQINLGVVLNASTGLPITYFRPSGFSGVPTPGSSFALSWARSALYFFDISSSNVVAMTTGGTLLWSVAIAGTQLGTAPVSIGGDDTVYVPFCSSSNVGQVGAFAALDPNSGTVLWHYTSDGGCTAITYFTGPAIGDDGTVIWVVPSSSLQVVGISSSSKTCGPCAALQRELDCCCWRDSRCDYRRHPFFALYCWWATRFGAGWTANLCRNHSAVIVHREERGGCTGSEGDGGWPSVKEVRQLLFTRR